MSSLRGSTSIWNISTSDIFFIKILIYCKFSIFSLQNVPGAVSGPPSSHPVTIIRQSSSIQPSSPPIMLRGVQLVQLSEAPPSNSAPEVPSYSLVNSSPTTPPRAASVPPNTTTFVAVSPRPSSVGPQLVLQGTDLLVSPNASTQQSIIHVKSPVASCSSLQLVNASQASPIRILTPPNIQMLSPPACPVQRDPSAANSVLTSSPSSIVYATPMSPQSTSITSEAVVATIAGKHFLSEGDPNPDNDRGACQSVGDQEALSDDQEKSDGKNSEKKPVGLHLRLNKNRITIFSENGETKHVDLDEIGSLEDDQEEDSREDKVPGEEDEEEEEDVEEEEEEEEEEDEDTEFQNSELLTEHLTEQEQLKLKHLREQQIQLERQIEQQQQLRQLKQRHQEQLQYLGDPDEDEHSFDERMDCFENLHDIDDKRGNNNKRRCYSEEQQAKEHEVYDVEDDDDENPAESFSREHEVVELHDDDEECRSASKEDMYYHDGEETSELQHELVNLGDDDDDTSSKSGKADDENRELQSDNKITCDFGLSSEDCKVANADSTEMILHCDDSVHHQEANPEENMVTSANSEHIETQFMRNSDFETHEIEEEYDCSRNLEEDSKVIKESGSDCKGDEGDEGMEDLGSIQNIDECLSNIVSLDNSEDCPPDLGPLDQIGDYPSNIDSFENLECPSNLDSLDDLASAINSPAQADEDSAQNEAMADEAHSGGNDKVPVSSESAVTAFDHSSNTSSTITLDNPSVEDQQEGCMIESSSNSEGPSQANCIDEMSQVGADVPIKEENFSADVQQVNSNVVMQQQQSNQFKIIHQQQVLFNKPLNCNQHLMQQAMMYQNNFMHNQINTMPDGNTPKNYMGPMVMTNNVMRHPNGNMMTNHPSNVRFHSFFNMQQNMGNQHMNIAANVGPINHVAGMNNMMPGNNGGGRIVTLSAVGGNAGGDRRGDNDEGSADDGCPCNMKAMVACLKCGAFCHHDCITPARICGMCLVR